MPDLREWLDGGASGYEPPPDGYDLVLLRAGRRTTRRRIASAVVAFVVATAGVGTAIVWLRPEARTTPSPGTSPFHRTVESSAGITAGADGLLVARCGNGICAERPDGSAARQVIAGLPWPQWDAAWSPNGRQIAFRGYHGPGDGEYALYTIDVTSCAITRLTRGIADDPTWSPEGDRIAFATTGAGAIGLVPAGGGRATMLTRDPDPRFADADPDWSASDLIAFVRYPEAHLFDPTFGRIHVIRPDGSGLHPITPAGFGEPSWSPDARRLAAVRYHRGTSSIWIMNADGTEAHRASGEGTAWSPTWAPDGVRLGYLMRRHGETSFVATPGNGPLFSTLIPHFDGEQVDWGAPAAGTTLRSGC